MIQQLPTTNSNEITHAPLVTLFEAEREIIQKRLDYFKGNKAQAAKSLGVTLKTIYNKMYSWQTKDLENKDDSTNL